MKLTDIIACMDSSKCEKTDTAMKNEYYDLDVIWI